MSKYLDRFIPAWEKSWSGNPDHESVGRWIFNKQQPTMYAVKNRKSVFTEEEYKGFALVIVERPSEVTQLLDDAGKPTDRYLERNQYTDGEKYQESRFYAFAWRIGGIGDDKTELEWLGDFADLAGICQSTSFKKTLSMARKHLDTYDVCYQVHDRLKAIADERLYADNPVINVLKGEEVFINAHGRRRKGIVVGTTGTRFIVGYVTPSNNTEIKTKTVHLQQIRKG